MHPERPSIRAAELLDAAAIEDPYPLFSRLRSESAVVEIEATGICIVSSWALVEEAVLRDEDFSANLTGLLYTDAAGAPAIFELGEVASSAGAVIATADEPEHAAHRAAVAPGLVASTIARLEDPIRRWTAERTQRLVDAGGGDYVRAVAEEVPSLVVATLLDAPPEDCASIQRWGMTGGDMLAGTTTPERMAALGAQTGELAAFLAAKLEERHGCAGLMGDLGRAVDRGAFDSLAAIGIAVTLVGAGVESTASLIGSAVRLLSERPDLQQTLRTEPTRIARFIEEALRLESPFRFHYRVVKRPCTLGSVELGPGDRLMLGWASANRDEAEFENADQIDLGRRFPRRHLGFGRGRHFCVGAHLARLEARIAIEELLMRSDAFAPEGTRAHRHVPSVFVRRLAELPLRMQRRASSG